MQFHQVLVSASPWDASTNSALELRELLSKVAPSEIFARYIDPALASVVHPLQDYGQTRATRSGTSDDVIVFHASIGEPSVYSFIRERPERLVLVYHNITPPEYFRAYDPAFAGLLEGGRRELSQLTDRCVLALAVSEYNAAELRDMGYRRVRVARLILELQEIANARIDARTMDWLDDLDGPVLLFVGQLLPHKRPDLLVKAFHVLSTYLHPDAHLLLVGANRLEPFAARLRAFAAELNLHRLHFMGSITDSARNACYRRADAFVTASEHEGFCVPLVEAMAFGVPVVARSYAAIPETVGDSALLLPQGEDSCLVAEAMHKVLSDADLRTALVERGHARTPLFDADAARANILNELLAVV